MLSEVNQCKVKQSRQNNAIDQNILYYVDIDVNGWYYNPVEEHT